MAHLYQLKDLQGECEEYLARNITKENAVEAWMAGGVSDSQKLRDQALMTIAKANIHLTLSGIFSSLTLTRTLYILNNRGRDNMKKY